MKVGFETAEEVTDSTADATLDEASPMDLATSSTTSACAKAAQAPRVRRAFTRIVIVECTA